MCRTFQTSKITYLSTIASESVMGGCANPLLSTSTLPYEAVPFDKIRCDDYEEAIIEGIRLQISEINAITESTEQPTFENTIAAFDRSGVILNRAVQTLGNLEAALGDEDLMAVMAKVTPILSEHSANILLNKNLWERIKTVYDMRGERCDLSTEDMRLISETYRNFAESGANLKGEDREKFRLLNTRLSELSVKFSQNVTNDMSSPERRLWIREEDTKGLPESIKTAAKDTARELLEADNQEYDDNLYVFTMYAPSYVPFMTYAENRDLREKLYRMYNTRNSHGLYDNTPIIREIVNTRLELSRLLGKKNYADYHLHGTMAGSPANVMSLLEELRRNYTIPMKNELAEILEYARKTEPSDFELKPWDYSFWSDKLKNDRYAFNSEDLKPYFELENTINGVLNLATKLYGYTFKENHDLPTYHPDVKIFEVYENDGSILGLLYADFYYRQGKSPGAWMTDFRTETKDDEGKRSLPLISIVCNFPRPIGDEPVLLTPDEVRTFLHEFGHALHGLSSQAKFASLSGTNVYHDFVELFSQFNENFLTETEFLDGFARHYKTGEKLPEELVEKFLKAQTYGAAYSCMRQLGFGYLDMAYHTIETPLADEISIENFEKLAQDPVRVFNAIEGCMTSPSFGHIFSGGYAAGYYGYKWSEVLDADAFSKFKENGVFDPETSRKLKKMLQSGGTEDPMTLYKEFRGRKPNINALLIRDGILESNQ